MINPSKIPCLIVIVFLLLSGCGKSERASDLTDNRLARSNQSPNTADPEIDARNSATTPVSFELRFGFGVVNQGEMIDRKFRILNDSDKSIEYTKYKLECNCTSVVGNSGPISPRDEGILTLRLDTRALQGKVLRRVLFYSEDPEIRPVTLVLSGTVAAIWAEPSTIDLGNLAFGIPSERSFLVAAAGFPDAKIASTTCESSVIDISTESVIPDDFAKLEGREPFYRVRLRWRGDVQPPGRFDSKIVLDTNIARFPTIEIPFVGNVLDPIELRPPKLIFGNVATGIRIVRSCELNSSEIPSGEIDSIDLKADHNFIHAVISHKPTTKNNIFVLDVILTLPVDAKKGVIKGKVVASKDGKSLFSVPYIAIVTDGT